jgi:hypothetical protein
MFLYPFSFGTSYARAGSQTSRFLPVTGKVCIVPYIGAKELNNDPYRVIWLSGEEHLV